ncbi:MAG: hypothetical protein GXO75_14560 [Calditrichaeota bacterium]|nr:hypothetical protein [Calditrichota bacterium]
MILILVIFYSDAMMACDYNVRDAGFVDLGSAPYHLFGLANKETDAQIISGFSQIAGESLNESNIKFELVDIDKQKDHPVIGIIDSLQIKSFPSAVFVSPDGQTMILALPNRSLSFKKQLKAVLQNILRSPKRDEIQKKIISAFAVVLLIEGTDRNENARARSAIVSANKKIALQMEMLPKAIAHPPVMVTLTRDMFRQEDVLLWSLGLHRENLVKPHVAIIYGRSRWVGPMFEGKQISAENLLSILYVIGQDCECGLDLSWVGGTMLPMQWNQETEARLAKSLGFDPENPYVKMEVSRIIRRGRRSNPDVAMGAQAPAPDSLAALKVSDDFNEDSLPHRGLSKSMFFSMGFLLMLLLVGLVIFFKGRKV